METFPIDVLNIIFANFNIETKIIARFVCRRWLKIIRYPGHVTCVKYIDSLELLQWAVSAKIPWSANMYVMASKNNNLEMIKWIRNNGYPRSFGMDVGMYAVSHNNIEFLNYLKEVNYQFTSLLTRHAAYLGNFSVLKWLRANQYPWNYEVLYFAISNGNFEMFKWAYENDCPHDSLSQLYKWALNSPNKDIKMYIQENIH